MNESEFASHEPKESDWISPEKQKDLTHVYVPKREYEELKELCRDLIAIIREKNNQADNLCGTNTDPPDAASFCGPQR